MSPSGLRFLHSRPQPLCLPPRPIVESGVSALRQRQSRHQSLCLPRSACGCSRVIPGRSRHRFRPSLTSGTTCPSVRVSRGGTLVGTRLRKELRVLWKPVFDLGCVAVSGSRIVYETRSQSFPIARADVRCRLLQHLLSFLVHVCACLLGYPPDGRSSARGWLLSCVLGAGHVSRPPSPLVVSVPPSVRLPRCLPLPRLTAVRSSSCQLLAVGSSHCCLWVPQALPRCPFPLR
jgi:hypothetical protein